MERPFFKSDEKVVSFIIRDFPRFDAPRDNWQQDAILHLLTDLNLFWNSVLPSVSAPCQDHYGIVRI
jgi:hypothetical protein